MFVIDQRVCNLPINKQNKSEDYKFSETESIQKAETVARDSCALHKNKRARVSKRDGKT